MGVAHWDEVESHRRSKGEMDATWQSLGNAAGTRGVGVNRVRVEPGKLPTPPHSHGASEELYFVLAGSGLAWQDGDVHEVRPLDCVIHRPDEMEHTFVAGPDGLEFIVFGTRHPTELGWLPRSRAIRLGWPWVEGRDDDPWDVEATLEPLAVGEPAPRPANIVNVDEVEHERARGSGDDRVPRDARALDSARAALGEDRGGPPRLRPALPFRGGGGLRHPRGHGDARAVAPRGRGRGETPLRAGHVVARPPGTRVSHSFRAGPDGVTMLIYGTRDRTTSAGTPARTRSSGAASA